MEKEKNITSLATLEREIYRLELEAKNKEITLEENMQFLRENFSSLLISSLYCKKPSSEAGKDCSFKSPWKNETVRSLVSEFTDMAAKRATVSLKSLAKKMFNGKKN